MLVYDRATSTKKGYRPTLFKGLSTKKSGYEETAISGELKEWTRGRIPCSNWTLRGASKNGKLNFHQVWRRERKKKTTI